MPFTVTGPTHEKRWARAPRVQRGPRRSPRPVRPRPGPVPAPPRHYADPECFGSAPVSKSWVVFCAFFSVVMPPRRAVVVGRSCCPCLGVISELLAGFTVAGLRCLLISARLSLLATDILDSAAAACISL